MKAAVSLTMMLLASGCSSDSGESNGKPNGEPPIRLLNETYLALPAEHGASFVVDGVGGANKSAIDRIFVAGHTRPAGIPVLAMLGPGNASDRVAVGPASAIWLEVTGVQNPNDANETGFLVVTRLGDRLPAVSWVSRNGDGWSVPESEIAWTGGSPVGAAWLGDGDPRILMQTVPGVMQLWKRSGGTWSQDGTPPMVVSPELAGNSTTLFICGPKLDGSVVLLTRGVQETSFQEHVLQVGGGGYIETMICGLYADETGVDVVWSGLPIGLAPDDGGTWAARMADGKVQVVEARSEGYSPNHGATAGGVTAVATGGDAGNIPDSLFVRDADGWSYCDAREAGQLYLLGMPAAGGQIWTATSEEAARIRLKAVSVPFAESPLGQTLDCTGPVPLAGQ